MFLLEYIAIGTVGFWALLGLIAICISEALDTDHPGIATIMAVGTVVGLWFLGFYPRDWIANHPFEFLMYIAEYVVAGGVWALIKWYFWLVKIRQYIETLQADRDPNIRGALQSRGYPTSFPVNVSDHKSKIIGWMTLWPASMVWTVLHDPVKWIFETLYRVMATTFDRISLHVFANVNIEKK